MPTCRKERWGAEEPREGGGIAGSIRQRARAWGLPWREEGWRAPRATRQDPRGPGSHLQSGRHGVASSCPVSQGGVEGQPADCLSLCPSARQGKDRGCPERGAAGNPGPRGPSSRHRPQPTCPAEHKGLPSVPSPHLPAPVPPGPRHSNGLARPGKPEGATTCHCTHRQTPTASGGQAQPCPTPHTPARHEGPSGTEPGPGPPRSQCRGANTS